MAKKKKNILNKILGITENVTGIASGIAKDFVGIEPIYNVGKDVAINTANAMAITDRKNKISKLLVDIGNRIYEKHIEVDDRNVKAEIQCIEELLEEKS